MILAITQARFGSSRLPGKVLKEVNGKTMLQIHLERLKRSSKIDRIIVATTFEPEAKRIISVAKENDVESFKGPTNDVLERYYLCALSIQPKIVVRITSDCPLIDPEIIDAVVGSFLEGKYDFASNGMKPTFPDGTDVEVFTFQTLEDAFRNATLYEEREHVTPYMEKNSSFFGKSIFKSLNYEQKENYSGYKFTLDTQNDFENLTILINQIGDKSSWRDYVSFVDKNPKLFKNIKSH
jgi:spore coat polysaccharide biosynthesis protein SpsF (cytidylyltransferase family)